MKVKLVLHDWYSHAEQRSEYEYATQHNAIHHGDTFNAEVEIDDHTLWVMKELKLTPCFYVVVDENGGPSATGQEYVSIWDIADSTGLPARWLRDETIAGRIPSVKIRRKTYYNERDAMAAIKILLATSGAGGPSA